jgi:hypothetical protein
VRRRGSHRAESAEQRMKAWLRQYRTPEMVRQAEELPVRRDMVTLLSYVRDHKVVGTQSTGNMPLKAVREVTGHFVEPPTLDMTIGDHTFHLRSEADVWSLYFLHILAVIGGLLDTAPARRWKLTRDGEDFLGLDPLLQVPFLVTVWWYEVNWLVAFPFEGMGEGLPPQFRSATAAHLHAQPVERPIPFEEFADSLIKKTGLRWVAPDPDVGTMLLRSSIEQMVIAILATFGAVEREYRQKPLGEGTIRTLAAFKITPFGKALLDAVAVVSK